MAEINEFTTKFRVMVVGDKKVGKTALVTRFIDGTFTENKTKGSKNERRSKIVELRGKKVKLQVLDTVSREWHQSVDTIDFQRADSILICFDVNNLSSFHDVSYWPKRIGSMENIVVALVATKCDKNFCRMVQYDMGLALARELGASYYETSAKTPSMVSELFHETASHLLADSAQLQSSTWDTITLEESPVFAPPEGTLQCRRRCCLS